MILEIYKFVLYDNNIYVLGSLAVAVPGELRGYWAAHQRFGTLQWEELVNPAIEICEKGYNMTNHQYQSLFKNNLDGDPNFK